MKKFFKVFAVLAAFVAVSFNANAQQFSTAPHAIIYIDSIRYMVVNSDTKSYKLVEYTKEDTLNWSNYIVIERKPDTLLTITPSVLEFPNSFIKKDYEVNETLTPSYYLKQSANARAIALASAVVGGVGAGLSTKFTKEGDYSFSIAIGVIGSITATVAEIFSIYYEHKAGDTMSKIKFTGNGISVSF